MREFRVVIHNFAGGKAVRYEGPDRKAAASELATIAELPAGYVGKLYSRSGEAGYASELRWSLEREVGTYARS